MRDPRAYQPGDRVQEVHTPAASVPNRPEGHARAWTGAPPLPYRDDRLPPPWYWATDFYKRKRRRPRCDGED